MGRWYSFMRTELRSDKMHNQCLCDVTQIITFV